MMVDLQPGDPQTCDAVISNPPVPGKEFFLRKFIAAASFFETDGAATHGRDNRGLTAVRPSVLCLRAILLTVFGTMPAGMAASKIMSLVVTQRVAQSLQAQRRLSTHLI
jgi:hypothetical protein